MNKAILLGRLGQDPEIKHLDSGTAHCKCSLATTEKYKNKQGEKVEETQWHNLVIWGAKAEMFAKWFKKGSEVLIEGKIKHDKYEKDGVVRFYSFIQVDNISFTAGSREKQDNGIDKRASQDVMPNGMVDLGEEEDDLPF